MFDESIDRFQLSGWRPDASAVTTWQAEQELHPSSLPGALRGRASAAELLNEADAAVRSGGGGGEEAKAAAAVVVQFCSRCSSLHDGGTPIQR